MADVIGDILGFAVGIAISPIPIIAVILMLFSARARINGLAFLLGWIGGISAVTVVVLLVAKGAGASDNDSQDGVAWVKVVLGLLLIGLAVREWRSRPAPGVAVEMPKWMSAIDSFTPAKAAGAGVVLSAANPKNFVLVVGGAATIAQAGLSGSKTTVVVIVFVLLASITIGAAVALYLVGGQRAQHVLDGWKVWLGQNNAAVMSVLLLVIGVVMLGKGFDAFD
jgi:threonine/homoserine/homoserine lactone efflux protein